MQTFWRLACVLLFCCFPDRKTGVHVKFICKRKMDNKSWPSSSLPDKCQDHTSQDHFCSVIDRFPVWNLEPDQPTLMSKATSPEHEEARCQYSFQLFRPLHWWLLVFWLVLENKGGSGCLSGQLSIMGCHSHPLRMKVEVCVPVADSHSLSILFEWIWNKYLNT